MLKILNAKVNIAAEEWIEMFVELIVNGELVITSSALLGAVKVSGSLRYEPEEALKATVINNKGTIMSKDLDCQYLFNHANILVKSSIISERIVNQVHGNISASSLKVTDELPLDMNQGMNPIFKPPFIFF